MSTLSEACLARWRGELVLNRHQRRREAKLNKNQHGIPIIGGVKHIEGNDKVRMEKCAAVINQALVEFDCIMIPRFELRPGKVDGFVDVIAKPRVLNGGN